MNRSNARARWGWLAASIGAISLVAAACGGGGGGPSAPTVTATTPADGATAVAITTDISVTFSQAMTPGTTQAAFSTTPATGCAFSWNPAGTTLTCEPTSELATTTAYTVAIATSATSTGGTPLASAFDFSFTTGAAVSDTCVFGTSLFGACRFGP